MHVQQTTIAQKTSARSRKLIVSVMGRQDRMTAINRMARGKPRTTRDANAANIPVSIQPRDRWKQYPPRATPMIAPITQATIVQTVNHSLRVIRITSP